MRITSEETMLKVPSGDFQKHIGRYQDIALTQPVVVTSRGRERTVLISTDEYHRLKRRDRQVMAAADFTDAELEEIANAEIPAEAAAFNHEFKE
ncbi:MAG TPA: type II toxin-antitoxin system prevent-host-death family antitoxin [Ktedonosporobacter sp.]|jgi:prevent-host-death family protein|nr:type II toxin-antitoxin system prevent-host-death family antitoxin [Ktedonosporobacter sp.]